MFFVYLKENQLHLYFWHTDWSVDTIQAITTARVPLVKMTLTKK